jgi:hypothetical protein
MNSLRINLSKIEFDYFEIKLNESIRIGQVIRFKKSMLKQKGIILKLCDARNNSLESFFDKTPSSPESTRNFLEEFCREESVKNLYLVYNNYANLNDLNTRNLCGHFGFKVDSENLIELSNVLSFYKDSGSEILFHSIGKFIGMIRNLEQNIEIQLKVLSSNKRAIKFYTKLGFEQCRFMDSEIALMKFKS